MEHLRAAIYCRISQDTEGEALGVARQEQDCRALAGRNGWTITKVYIDNDIGASTRSRKKVRPEFNKMVADVEQGLIDVIISYSNSRLTRRPLELESVIQLHERTNVQLATVVSGQDDLSTADGRMVARIKASVDAAEVERAAERVARKHLHSAQTGRPVGGTRPFGWRDDKVTPDPVEARLIRQAAKDILAGVPTRQICTAWNDQGITTSKGNGWSLSSLRQMMLSPRLAGWRIHRGRVCLGTDGEPVRGQWEPILDDATHEALKARLRRSDRRARVPRRNARHYLLTGTARCGICGKAMYGNGYSKGRHYYRCSDGDGVTEKHTVSISGVSLDDLIEQIVVARLGRESFEAPAPTFDGAAELADVEGQIRELMDAYNARTLTGAVVFPAVSELEAQRDRLVAERKQVEAASASETLTRVTADSFPALPVDRRRAVIETLISAVLVRPAQHHSNQFDPERVDVIWRNT